MARQSSSTSPPPSLSGDDPSGGTPSEKTPEPSISTPPPDASEPPRNRITPPDEPVRPLSTNSKRRNLDSTHRVAKNMLSPYRLVWVCAAIAIVVPCACLYGVWKIIEAEKKPFRTIIIDPATNFIVGPAAGVDATPLFEHTARFVALAALSRSAVGFDHDTLVSGLFYEETQQRIRDDLSRQLPNLQAQKLHQKVEIGKIETVQAVEDVRKTQISGQLVRAGKDANGYAVSQAEPFLLIVVLVPNPKFGDRGTYPYVVRDYRLVVGERAAARPRKPRETPPPQSGGARK